MNFIKVVYYSVNMVEKLFLLFLHILLSVFFKQIINS